MNKKENNKTKYSFYAFLILWLVLWGLIASFNENLILPGPAETFNSLIALAATKVFWMDIMWTLLRCILGVIISFSIGALCAALAHKNNYFRDFLKIPVSFFKSVPVMAVIIYVILIAKSDWVAIIVCFLMCFPIAYTNILSGLDNFKDEYIELARVMEMDKKETFNLIYRPALQPSVSSALSLITGMSFKVVVAAEILAIPNYSIGYEMMNAKYYLETPKLFAYIVVLVVLSILTENIVKKATTLRMSGFHSLVIDAAMREGKYNSSDGSAMREGKHNSSDAATMREGKNNSHGGADLKEKTDEAMLSEASVVISDVCKKYSDEITVFDKLNLSFGEGVTALSAPSGRGKTTLARMIAGLELPDSGRITLNSDGISYLFQDDRLLPWLNVYDNMALGLIGSGAGDIDKKIKETAHNLELDDVLLMMPSELSGGMAHRVAMGRSALRDADILILDEPFRGLDEGLKDRIIERMWKPLTSQKTVILITHDYKLAEEMSDRIVEL